jgi:hypothetical protein
MWAVVIYGSPIAVVLLGLGRLVLAPPGATAARLQGLTLIALGAGQLALTAWWVNDACYDVGDPCGGKLVEWAAPAGGIVCISVVLVAIAMGLDRLFRSRER